MTTPLERIRSYLDDAVLPLDIVRGIAALLDIAEAAQAVVDDWDRRGTGGTDTNVAGPLRTAVKKIPQHLPEAGE